MDSIILVLVTHLKKVLDFQVKGFYPETIGKGNFDMPRVIPEISQTEIGQIITDRMDELGMSIKELSIKTDITYEHIRRIVRGEGVPAKYTLKAICEVLNIPYKEAEKATITDKVKKKYGSSYLEMTGMKPTLEPISRVWDSLTHEQQQDAIDLINGWAKRNKLSKQS